MKFFLPFIALVFGVSLACAQVPLPQTVPSPLVPNGLNSSGIFTSRQITTYDIDSPFPNTTSGSSFLLQAGQLAFALDDPTQISVGFGLLITSINDPTNWAVCIVTSIDPYGYVLCDTTIVQGGGIVDSNWSIQAISGATLQGVSVWQGLGVDNTTSLTFPSVGQSTSLTIDQGKIFQYGSPVYVWTFSDPVNSWFAGYVTSYNSATGAITIQVTFASATGTSRAGWYVSIAPLITNSVSNGIFSGIITPTALGINVSAVDAVNNFVTFPSPHGITTGQCGILTGVVAAGLTTNTGYYFGVLSPTTLAFYTTLANAYADTSRVDITTTTTAWSLRTFIYTNVFQSNMDTNGPVCPFSNANTTMHFDFNVNGHIINGQSLLQLEAGGIFNTTPVVGSWWHGGQNFPGTTRYTTTITGGTQFTVSYSGSLLDTATNLSQGTWANQGTNGFGVNAMIYAN